GGVGRERSTQCRDSRVPSIGGRGAAGSALWDGRLLRVSCHDRWSSTSPCVHDDCVSGNEDRNRGGGTRDSMTKHIEQIDVLVIGGGPAGIAAASCASERGARVLLVDEGTQPGGQIWRASLTKPSPAVARRWISRLAA